MTKTSLGIEENLEGALCYLLGFITGIVFYVLEPKNRFVRFHAMQSIIIFLPLFIISFVLGFIPVIGWIIGTLLWILVLILWLILMIKAYQGILFKIPIAGDIAQANS